MFVLCLYSSCGGVFIFFFFKQKTAYEMRISDWSSDVCSSDLSQGAHPSGRGRTVRPAHHAANGRTTGNGHTDRLGRLAEPHCGRIGGGPSIGGASCRERVCQYV